MTFNYAGIAETTLRQIDDKGRTVGLIRKQQGKYNADTDTFNNKSVSQISVKAVILDFRKSQIDGNLVKRGDKLALVAAQGIQKPEVSDKLDDEVEYSIVNVEEVKPGDTPLLYKLQIRR